MVSLTVSIGCI